MGQRKEKFGKVASLIGAHFLTAPSSFMWNYGNLSAYMESYFHMYCFPGCVDGDSQWIINLYAASFCPGLCLSGPICRHLGMRWAGIFAMIICNIGLISSAWTIRVSVIETSLLMGLLNGMGMGTSLCTAFMYVNAWAGKNKGLFVATVTSAPTILSILQNQIITIYVNPKNLKPDAVIGHKTYFSERAMLERVPTIVFILGLMTFGLQLIGNMLVSNPPSTLQNTSSQSRNDTEKANTNNACFKKSSDNHEQNNTDCHNPSTDSKDISGKQPFRYLSIDRTGDQSQKSISLQNNISDTQSFAVKSAGEISHDIEEGLASTEQLPRSYKPLEALKTGSFRALWLFVVALMYGLILKNNYYKQFGLLYIKNDRFLTLVGSLIPVTASIARITFGSLMDREILGIKSCMIITLSINSLLCMFWWFIPQVNGVAYMILILSLASVHSVTYTLAATGTLLLFGPTHFATNFALVYTAATVTSVVTALTVSPLLQALGWFWIFASCGIVSGIALLCTTLINMEKKKA